MNKDNVSSLAGMSRSVTVAVAYIMSTTNLSWKEALKVVRVGRSIANPNVGFQQQLKDFESSRLQDVSRTNDNSSNLQKIQTHVYVRTYRTFFFFSASVSFRTVTRSLFPANNFFFCVRIPIYYKNLQIVVDVILHQIRFLLYYILM